MFRALMVMLFAFASVAANDRDIKQAKNYIKANRPNGYLPKKKTGLNFALECDAKNNACFIVLEGKKHFIGSGAHKKVHKAIHLNGRPKVVARGVEETKNSREFRFTKKLQGKPGIFKTVGFGSYKRKGKTYRSIYSKLYRPGSLHEALESRIRLSRYEKMKLASDMLIGLVSMHEEKIVHRDLAARNFFVDIPKGKPKYRDVSAVIADMGHAMYAKHAGGTKVTGNAKYTPPEGLFIKKLKGKDYYKTDIFTVGCVLWWLYYGSPPQWFDKSYAKDLHIPAQVRYKKLKAAIERYRKPRLKASKDPFEQVILKMVHTNPIKRGTAQQLSLKMQKILQHFLAGKGVDKG
ncbi:MAG: protein kinase [Verrucomicrobia bacterium]|nr:protein kinase [Verrucomicrobiota bacterium]